MPEQQKKGENSENTIYKAMEACKSSGVPIEDNFGEVTSFTKMNTGAPGKLVIKSIMQIQREQRKLLDSKNKK